MMIYDRPVSAKVADDRKKTGKMPISNALSDKLGGYDMITGGSTKKRYPSTNHRE